MTRSITLRGVLAASAIAEGATGIVLAVAPALVTSLLFGTEASRHWSPLGRVAGVALLALGLACWPGTSVAGERTAAAHAMLAYNPLIASYLVYLAAVGVAGILLWPAVAVHGIVTLLLCVAWRNERRAPESKMVLPAVLLLGVAAVLAAFSIPTTIGRQATATRGVATYADALYSNAIPPAPPKLGVEIKDTALVLDTFRSRATRRERR